MNNLNEIPKNTPKFQLRYLITERFERWQSSWCSEPPVLTKIKSKPILQYTSNGVDWITVDIVVEEVSL